jgi:hypothetical protein
MLHHPFYSAATDNAASSFLFCATAAAAVAALSFLFCCFSPFFAAKDDTVASVAFLDGFLTLLLAVDDLVVVPEDAAVVVAVITTSPTTARFCHFPRRGELPPSPAPAMGYCLRVLVGATAQSNTGRRNIKLRECDILMELASNMKNIFFSVWTVYRGIRGTLIV